MARYRKKPIIIDAEPYHEGLEDGFGYPYKHMAVDGKGPLMPYIQTLEGNMYISSTDYIITGVKGERYPCKKDIFEQTYDFVDEVAE